MSDLSTFSTQELLDEFLLRASRGEAVPPINDWIAKLAALGLIKRHTQFVNTPLHNQWLLDRVVRALTGAEYDQWVEDYQKDGTSWTSGEEPQTGEREPKHRLADVWNGLTPEEQDVVLGGILSKDHVVMFTQRGMLEQDGNDVRWTAEGRALRRYALSLKG